MPPAKEGCCEQKGKGKGKGIKQRQSLAESVGADFQSASDTL